MNGIGKIDHLSTCKEISLKLNLILHTNINSKHIIGPKIKHETIKQLEDMQNLHDLGWVEEFLAMKTKVWSIKEKKWVNWTSLKLKTFAHQWPLLREWKDKWQNGRKYLFANHMFDKVIIFRICKKKKNPQNSTIWKQAD